MRCHWRKLIFLWKQRSAGVGFLVRGSCPLPPLCIGIPCSLNLSRPCVCCHSRIYAHPVCVYMCVCVITVELVQTLCCQGLYIHMHISPTVSGRRVFLGVRHALWFLQFSHPNFCRAPWSLREESAADIPLRTECSRISCCLYTVRLWLFKITINPLFKGHDICR